MILVIPLSAWFCVGKWEFGRIGWSAGQDGETLKMRVHPIQFGHWTGRYERQKPLYFMYAPLNELCVSETTSLAFSSYDNLFSDIEDLENAGKPRQRDNAIGSRVNWKKSF